MRRYGLVTSLLYDVFSGERPVYRAARIEAVQRLHLSPGDAVLVLGAGTGLDLPLLAEEVGPSGLLVAVDDSPVMLRRAGRRRRPGWPEVRLVQADLTRARTVLPPGVGPVDAVLAVNTLSLIPDWRAAWRRGRDAAKPGARVAVADIGRPDGGTLIRVWAPLISAIGLGRLDARPWRAVEEETSDAQSASWHHGHVELRTGTLPRPEAPGRKD